MKNSENLNKYEELMKLQGKAIIDRLKQYHCNLIKNLIYLFFIIFGIILINIYINYKINNKIQHYDQKLKEINVKFQVLQSLNVSQKNQFRREIKNLYQMQKSQAFEQNYFQEELIKLQNIPNIRKELENIKSQSK